ncbi:MULTISPECIES: palindromic element RPE3 domain-containing protein [unclassified Rickettsia]|nr:palindromic element RPE3 domain-containing protein [Rickettsia endosymbiont of Ceutorhynchus assimilis]
MTSKIRAMQQGLRLPRNDGFSIQLNSERFRQDEFKGEPALAVNNT